MPFCENEENNDRRSERNLCNYVKASLRNCINCVHCDDHFFIFISFPQFIYDLFHISLTLSFCPDKFYLCKKCYICTKQNQYFNYFSLSSHSCIVKWCSVFLEEIKIHETNSLIANTT